MHNDHPFVFVDLILSEKIDNYHLQKYNYDKLFYRIVFL